MTQRTTRILSVLGVIAILAMVAQPADAAKARVAKTVAINGQSLPSTGFTMEFPDEPMVDSKGNVVFGAFYNTNHDSGIFYKPMKKGLSAVATTMVAISGLELRRNSMVLRLVRRELLPSSRAVERPTDW